MRPVMTVSAITRTMAGRISRNMANLPERTNLQNENVCSDEMQGIDHEVDGLDPGERNDDAAEPVDQQVPLQQRPGADRAIGDPFERERNQRDDDQRVEDDRG